MLVVKYKKIFFSVSAVAVGLSFAAGLLYGLNFGIDFKGGALTEVSYRGERPAVSEIKEKISPLGLGEITVQETGASGHIIRSRFLEEKERQALLEALSFGGTREVSQNRYSAIGPTVGEELKNKAFIAIGAVVLAIIIFIAYVFRQVSKPVSSWKYGLSAIIALIHDIAIPTGVFAVLGYFYGVEVNALFVTALLAILGYSVNDTIIIFDRVRENLKENYTRGVRKPFEEVVGESLEGVYARSLNTSLTTVLALLALFFFGPSVTAYFSLALIIGIVAGTYSSICLAAPLLLSFAGESGNKMS